MVTKETKTCYILICLEYDIADDGEMTNWLAASDKNLVPGSNEYEGKSSTQLANFLKRLTSVKNQRVVLVSHHLTRLIQYLKNKLKGFKVHIEGLNYEFSKIKVRDIDKLTNSDPRKATEMLKKFKQLESMLPLDDLPVSINAVIRKQAIDYLLTFKDDDDSDTRNAKRRYRRNLWSSNLDAQRLRMIEASTRGGLDVVNNKFVGITLTNAVGYDGTSFYPDILETKEFPFGAGRWVNTDDAQEVRHACCFHPCLLEVEFTRIELVKKIPYIRPQSAEEPIWYSYKNNNEPDYNLVYAKKCTCIIWNAELDIIKKAYKYQKIKIVRCLEFDSSMLDLRFRAWLAPFFEAKTLKKGTDEEAAAKITLNAMAGNFQKRPIKPDQLAEKLGKKKVEYDDQLNGFTDEELNDALESYYNQTRGDDAKFNRFWSYVQGKYLTMLGRVMLYEHILENVDDFVMSATDAAYFINNKDKYFEHINRCHYVDDLITVVNKSKGMIKLEQFMPKNRLGKIKMLGSFEPTYFEKLKVLGPKRYLKQEVGHEPELVHSGLKKIESFAKLKETGDIWKNYTDSFKGVTKPTWIIEDNPLDTREDAYARPRIISEEERLLRLHMRA